MCSTTLFYFVFKLFLQRMPLRARLRGNLAKNIFTHISELQFSVFFLYFFFSFLYL